MSAEHKLVDEHDIGLMLWVDEATRGLGPEETRRIREETTEHFLAALDELRNEGRPEGEARVAALERLGDSGDANIEYLTTHFTNAASPTIGTPTSRRWSGLATVLVAIPLLLVNLHRSGSQPVPTAAYAAIGAVIVAALFASFAARHSFALWFGSQCAGVLACAVLFLSIPETVGRFTAVIVLCVQVWFAVKMSRSMTVSNR